MFRSTEKDTMTVWLAISAKGEKLYVESDRWFDAHHYAKSVFHEDNPECRATIQCDSDVSLRWVGSDYNYPPNRRLEVRKMEASGWSEWEALS
jgi:hypothetical protein